jgi:aminopeptidase N
MYWRKMFPATMKLVLLALSIASLTTNANEQRRATSPAALFDVIHYDARLEPDIARKMVTGKVLIKLKARIDNLATVELDCADLTINAVRESGQEQKFVRTDRRLVVSLARPAKASEMRELEVQYHGTPVRGIRFFPDQDQVYTVFSTSEWLVCVDAPDDRATLRLNLVLPATLNAVANGRLEGRHTSTNNKVLYEWRQEMPIPTYTFGFAAGRFRTLMEKRGHVQLRYLATQFSDEELRRIFRDTSDTISFYEDRSGVRYADTTYTQVLAAGRIEQEMSGFTVIRESYGRDPLANERDVWLMAHELAHQWWGNRVTCRDWTHFWLNEGMATFMAAAYKEQRFGREEYDREIEQYRTRYEKVRDSGKDRSLHFPDWVHPTPEDRALVYQKGAYLHLLREQLGERLFWMGIRQYTRKYFGKSVTTTDFQTAMEQATGRNLSQFFSKWVYLTQQ